MIRPRRSSDTRQRLLEEGVAAFMENGYHGTGIKEVLDRIQVPKGSFYNYFASKEEFGAATIRHYSDCFAQKMTEFVGGARQPLAGFRRLLRQLMKEFEENHFTGGCLIANLGGELEGSEMCRDALQEGMHAWREGVRKVLQSGQEQGTVRDDLNAGELADIFIDAWEGAVIRMKIEQSLKPLRGCVRRLLDDYFTP